MSRPLLVGALVSAVTALLGSAAFAVGPIGGPSSGPASRTNMMGGNGKNQVIALTPPGTSTTSTAFRALVVDDEPSLTRVVAGYLEHEGFVPPEARGGFEPRPGA